MGNESMRNEKVEVNDRRQTGKRAIGTSLFFG
jgi:hypothetical protein